MLREKILLNDKNKNYLKDKIKKRSVDGETYR